MKRSKEEKETLKRAKQLEKERRKAEKAREKAEKARKKAEKSKGKQGSKGSVKKGNPNEEGAEMFVIKEEMFSGSKTSSSKGRKDSRSKTFSASHRGSRSPSCSPSPVSHKGPVFSDDFGDMPSNECNGEYHQIPMAESAQQVVSEYSLGFNLPPSQPTGPQRHHHGSPQHPSGFHVQNNGQASRGEVSTSHSPGALAATGVYFNSTMTGVQGPTIVGETSPGRIVSEYSLPRVTSSGRTNKMGIRDEGIGGRAMSESSEGEVVQDTLQVQRGPPQRGSGDWNQPMTNLGSSIRPDGLGLNQSISLSVSTGDNTFGMELPSKEEEVEAATVRTIPEVSPREPAGRTTVSRFRGSSDSGSDDEEELYQPPAPQAKVLQPPMLVSVTQPSTEGFPNMAEQVGAVGHITNPFLDSPAAGPGVMADQYLDFDATMPPPEAVHEDMWTIVARGRESIPVLDLANMLVQRSGQGMDVGIVGEILEKMAMSPFVSAPFFHNLEKLFGSVERVLINMVRLLKGKYFYMHMNENTVLRVLGQATPGTYLVRFRSKDVDDLVLNYVDGKGVVQGKRIEPRFHMGGYGIEGDGDVYAGVPEILQQYREFFIHPYLDEVWEMECFHGLIPTPVVVGMLQNAPLGTFLIRYSSQVNAYAVSQMVLLNGVRTVGHTRILKQPNGMYCDPKTGKQWSTMGEVVNLPIFQHPFLNPTVSVRILSNKL